MPAATLAAWTRAARAVGSAAAPVGLGIALVLGCTAPRPSAGSPAQPAPGVAPGPQAPAVQTAEPLRVVYLTTGKTWSQVPLLVADQQGFFAAEHLDVEINFGGQSSTVCQSLSSRSVDMGNCSINDLIQSVEIGGAPLAILMTESVTALNYAAVAKPEYRMWHDLRGKLLMVDSPRGNTVYFWRTMARANGLADDEYDFQYAGTTNARYAALKSGAVDAVILTDPFDAEAVKEGYTRLDDLRPKYINADNYLGPGPAVNRDWARENPEAAVRYVRAALAAIRWIYDPANKETLLAQMEATLNLSREALDYTYQRNVVDFKQWSTDGRVKDSAIQGVLDSLVELGYLDRPTPPPTKYYDMTYVELAHQAPRQ
ncbi:MAG TPA: ABC transporter substrate-binding protein [Chloroflexota bacterium]|jgi:NitT/TauT family transport system substrate-binding protein